MPPLLKRILKLVFVVNYSNTAKLEVISLNVIKR
jgi:hypothetical protein